MLPGLNDDMNAVLKREKARAEANMKSEFSIAGVIYRRDRKCRFGLVKQVEAVRPESVSGQRQERLAVRLRVERNVAI